MLVSLNNSAIELGVVGNFESEKYSSAVARVSIAASWNRQRFWIYRSL